MQSRGNSPTRLMGEKIETSTLENPRAEAMHSPRHSSPRSQKTSPKGFTAGSRGPIRRQPQRLWKVFGELNCGAWSREQREQMKYSFNQWQRPHWQMWHWQKERWHSNESVQAHRQAALKLCSRLHSSSENRQNPGSGSHQSGEHLLPWDGGGVREAGHTLKGILDFGGGRYVGVCFRITYGTVLCTF